MALNLIFRYQIKTATGGLGVGQYVNTFWNTSTEAIEVYEYDDESDTTGTLMTSGPDLGARRQDYELFNSAGREGGGYSIYNFCDGLDLTSFRSKSNFPYTEIIVQTNHASCSLTVCDLSIDEYTTVAASDSVTADGIVTLEASSSNGPIKFSTDPDFDYSSEGQSSPQFTGLLAGSYTFYAKDAIGCFDSIDIVLGVPVQYGPKYRLDYPDANNINTRIDILERGYTGDVIPVEGTGEPFTLKYNGNDINKFKPVIASEARLNLLSPEHFYFLDLFTQDERKYQMRYYKMFDAPSTPFTPAVLDALNLWTNVAGSGIDWTTGAVPRIEFNLTPINSYSDLLKTDYAFEASREYTFSYTFRGQNDNGWYPAGVTFYIQVLDASNNVLEEKIVPLPSNGTAITTITGEYTFIAPSGAVSIAVQAYQPSAVALATYHIDAFDNETQADPGGIVEYDLKWIGYLLAANYSEIYGPTPYQVTIVATDGLADLKKESFVDSAGNKFRDDIVTMKAIVEILRKTDLGLNIISAVNRLEESMTSNALVESKFDASTFLADNEDQTPEDCFTVLEQIIKPFGCRIYQKNAKWIIQTIEEAVHEFEYQEYNAEGVLISDGTINDFLEIQNRILAMEAAFTSRDQVLEIIPAYGVLFFEHTLLERPSLVRSYSFEQEDVYETPEGKAAFTHWNVNISESPGAEFGIKATNAFEGKYNFYYKIIRTTLGEPGERIKLTSAEGSIEYSNQDAFEYKFQYSAILSPEGLNRAGTPYPSNPPLWVRLSWMLKVGSYYYNEFFGWSDNEAHKYNSIYVDAFNDGQDYNIVAPMRDVGDEPVLEDFQVEFILHNEKYVDFESDEFATNHSALTNIPTVDLWPGYRVKGKIIYTPPGGSPLSAFSYFYYELSDENSDNDGDEIIRPDDYDDDTNQKVWVLQEKYVIRRVAPRSDRYTANPVPDSRITYWYMDNVVLRLLPNGAEPADNITIEKTNNVNIKIDYEDQFLLNDMDIDNINNSERTYKNFFNKLDGTPTQVWERTYRPGSGKLLELYANDYTSQYKNYGFKLTGSMKVGQEINYGTIMKELFDNSKMYMFMGFELRDRSYSVGFDLSELKDVVNDPDSPDIDAGFTVGYSLGFRA
jgi:hypothetical protein